MRLHRFIGNFNISGKKLRINDGELSEQIRKVLRLRVGDEVMLSDGKLNEAKVRLVSFEKDLIEAEILEKYLNNNEPKNTVVLYCAVLKKENFELVVQKATEIGIKEIVPLVTERTVKLDIRKDRLEKIIKEAAEQSGRGIVPVLHGPTDFKKTINNTNKSGLNFFCDQSGEDFSSLALDTKYPILNTNLWIGPEGGWTENELKVAKDRGFNIVSLGKTTLRAETAAVISTYLSIHNL